MHDGFIYMDDYHHLEILHCKSVYYYYKNYFKQLTSMQVIYNFTGISN